jgi:hypothetical protein
MKALMSYRLRPAAVALLALACLAPHAATQTPKRDHLTAQEIEVVRDAQDLDTRTGVFIKAVERRLRIIFNQPAPDSKPEKQIAEILGALPTGSHADLFYDIAHILDEAIENIDDTAQHNPKSPLLAKSVRKLSDASERFAAQLAPLRETVADKAEREQLEQALDNLQQIISAAKKLPAEETKGKPDKKG